VTVHEGELNLAQQRLCATSHCVTYYQASVTVLSRQLARACKLRVARLPVPKISAPPAILDAVNGVKRVGPERVGCPVSC
jgi:hypothetical protein